uniref:Uncharacterized protein n=1 Tax=Candidatus Kentrum sp. DK TaxID=2126562 RepID=A0A450SDP3_9GAMM|nr:MAG: hypothetical protein BECKDK2373C_GA0170839_102932 [Candidatus Kentron sp. DK]
MKQALSLFAEYTACANLEHLSAKSETANEIAVTLNVFSLEIFKELPALTDSFYQPVAGMVIVRMNFEMFSEMLNMAGQQRDLHLRRSGIFRRPLEIRYDL